MEELLKQLEVAKRSLRRDTEVYVTFCEVTKLIELFLGYMEMDKKIKKIQREEKVATAHLKKASKETGSLLKLDKVQDKKLKKAGVKAE